MVKIKQKKTMNLPQLIEWGFENNVRNQSFLTYDSEGIASEVHFDIRGLPKFSSMTDKQDLFTVKVEEEITEDTVIPKLLTTFETINVKNKVRYQRVRIDENYSIKLMLNIAEAHGEPIETLHIVNDDGTHKLIWRDGKLVE